MALHIVPAGSLVLRDRRRVRFRAGTCCAGRVIVIGVLTVAAGLFAGVFALSSASKLRHPAAAAMAIHRFGVLPWVRPIYGRLLGALELLLALWLVLYPTSAAPFAVGACLLAAFMFLIARALAGGHRFACACFGDSDENLSIRTLIRAGALLLLAVAAAIFGKIQASSGLTWYTHVMGVAVGLLLLCAVFVSVDLMRAHPFSTRLESDV